MAAFSSLLREKWGLGAAAGVALCITLGAWAYNSGGGGNRANAAPLRPQMAASASVPPASGSAPLDLPAGGSGDAAAALLPAPRAKSEMVMVHVTGSVKNPGVYQLKPGDRINDAVKAAGGFKANAQQDALNLADTVRDADQIFVPAQVSAAEAAAKAGDQSGATFDAVAAPVSAPRHPLIVRGTPVRVALAATSAVPTADTPLASNSDEPAAAPPAVVAPSPAPQGRVLGRPAAEGTGETSGDDPPGTAPSVSVGKSETPRTRTTGSVRKTSGSVSKSGGHGSSPTKFKNPGDGMVHLNSAGASELEKLPGVGPAMSARILEYRHQIGGFKSIEQMLDVKGIGDKKFAKMRPFLTL